MHLAVYPPTGRVRLAAPLAIKDDAIRLFAISKLSWIKRRQEKFREQERQLPREYKDRESHYYLGQRYLLEVIEKDEAPRVKLPSKTRMVLQVRPGATLLKRHEVMQEWYRQRLKDILPPMISKWEKEMRIKVDDWQIKKMKTKWGSCNTNARRIWLNLELAKKPVRCIEYIVVHELVHLLERHHNEYFVAYMDKYLPQWKQLKVELNKLPVAHEEWGY